MKIVFFGDSITDAVRDREERFANARFGSGYVAQIAGRLYERSYIDYEIVNRGISGNRIVDLYARVKEDVWNLEPDVLSILIGINDVWHEIGRRAGVEPERFEKVYRMLIEETKERLPQTRIFLCEPFVLRGAATEERFADFSRVTQYGAIVEKLAKEYGLIFVPLQKRFTEEAARCGAETLLGDGVHPTVQGSVLLACEWLRYFDGVNR